MSLFAECPSLRHVAATSPALHVHFPPQGPRHDFCHRKKNDIYCDVTACLPSNASSLTLTTPLSSVIPPIFKDRETETQV